MKIAIINDTHFGARADSQIFTDYFFKFFEEQFFPYLKENDIKTVFHLGDLMDRRKFVNFNTLNNTRKRFLEPLKEMGVKTHVILGNHDTYYKNTNDLNSVRELVGDFYNNFNIIETPQELWIEDQGFVMIPWINKSNTDECMKLLANTACPIACGHFELSGYEVLPGIKHDGGMSDAPLKRFEQVWSGHFHQKSSKGNIHYLGTQYQITFSDLNIKKGFHVFDTETRNVTFIENSLKMFHAIDYDDTDSEKIENWIKTYDFSEYKDGYIKVFVRYKRSPYLFDRFLDKLYNAQVTNVTIIEDMTQEELGDDDVVDMSKDTLTLIINEIDGMSELENTSKLKKIIKDLYMESLSL